MNISLFATKIGMSQIFINFERVPITILKINNNIITNKFYYNKLNKYTIQLGYKSIKPEKINKPQFGFFNKLNITPQKYMKEQVVSKSVFEKTNIGNVLSTNGLGNYSYIKVSGTSIGKGFAGVIKRHNFKGFPATHGTHEMFRHGGSIGCRTTPGRVFKGKKMPGRLGGKNTTIANIKIIKYLEDDNYLFVKGSTPGCKKSINFIKFYNTPC